MKSKSTFAEELNNIGSIQGILLSELEASGERFPSDRVETFDATPNGDCRAPVSVEAQVLDEEAIGNHVDGFDGQVAPIDLARIDTNKSPLPSELMTDILGIDVEAAMRTIATSGTLVRKRVAEATALLGTDAFGVYLPWHKHARSRGTPWGMYLFLEPLVWWAADLYQAASRAGLTLTPSKAFDLAFYITYRHEQFHFHVERFTIRLEVLRRQPVYLPYDRQVYCCNAGTADWLEEALAQAVVLESSFLFRKLGQTKRQLKPFIASEFGNFGPGYRDFDCKAWRGPKEAHKVLAAQIATASAQPGFAATEAVTPKHEYRVAPKAVPGYLAFRPWFVSQFQLSMPKHQQWRRWAAQNGFQHEGPGPGDHEVWTRSGQRVHINCRGKELDIASMKAVARMSGTGLRHLVEQVRAS